MGLLPPQLDWPCFKAFLDIIASLKMWELGSWLLIPSNGTPSYQVMANCFICPQHLACNFRTCCCLDWQSTLPAKDCSVMPG